MHCFYVFQYFLPSKQNNSHVNQRSKIESELQVQQCAVQTLEEHVDVLQTELDQSRVEMKAASSIVDDLSKKISDQEALMMRREAELESQIKEKGAFAICNLFTNLTYCI